MPVQTLNYVPKDGIKYLIVSLCRQKPLQESISLRVRTIKKKTHGRIVVDRSLARSSRQLISKVL